MFDNLEKYLRGDVVREVSDNLHSIGEVLRQIHFQEVALA